MSKKNRLGTSTLRAEPEQSNSGIDELIEPILERPLPHPIHGRGASTNPANRFEALRIDRDPEERPEDDLPALTTRFYRDFTRTIIAHNDSPDVGFESSINPYRGCEHGCVYCYARPTHEYLGFSAGLDFESRIMVKEDAPELLAAELSSPRWKPQTLVMSGVTDPYQPIERRLKLTRRCLEVLARFRNPVGIITKSQLATRDTDLLVELAAHDAAAVNISVTSIDPKLQRVLEPRASAPRARLDAIAHFRRAGVPVGVMVAPIIPGLTDHEVPAILQACADAGAQFAGYVVVRLPLGVAPLFERWLAEHFPDRKKKVLGRIRHLRGGRLNDPRFKNRMHGEGIFAEQIRALFEAGCKRAGLGDRPRLSTAGFRAPGEQLRLF